MTNLPIKNKPDSLHSAGLPLDFQPVYTALAQAANQTTREIVSAYPKTAQLFEALLSDPRVMTHWNLANYIAVIKLGYNDHGPIHAQVVTAAAMRLMQLLHQRGVAFDVIESGAGDLDDAHAVVLAGIMLHDIGNQIHRTGHEVFSVALAQPILERHLTPLYGDDLVKLQALTGFTLSAIACHDCNPSPLTMEGAVVAVADATDMTKGRGRVAFDRGKIDIHSVSALGVETVDIRAGGDKPIEIVVALSNSAGIFQVEQVFARKLIATPLKDYVTIRAIAADYPDTEQHIIRNVVFDGTRFRLDEDADHPAA